MPGGEIREGSGDLVPQPGVKIWGLEAVRVEDHHLTTALEGFFLSPGKQVLPETLRAWGAEVDVVPAYQTRPPAGAAERLARTLDEGVDVVTFTASSTVRNLLTLLDEPRRQALAAACREGRTLVAAIGPITARAAEEAGLPVAVRPAVYTIEALVAALAARLGAR